MRNAFEAGTIVAVVAALVGYFVVLRGLAFAGHALAHIGFAGATGAVLIGITPVAGLLTFTVSAATAMGILGKRIHGRDVVIGTVLAWMLGLGVLFISLYTGSATSAFAILFGEILGITRRDVLVTLVTGLLTLAAIGVMYRPLLFASLDEEVAEARGVPVRMLGVAFMIALAFAVSEAVQVVGVLLIFALVVTPAAIAERLTARPRSPCCWRSGFRWRSPGAGWRSRTTRPYPVSFFITSLAFGTYILVRLGRSIASRGTSGDARPTLPPSPSMPKPSAVSVDYGDRFDGQQV